MEIIAINFNFMAQLTEEDIREAFISARLPMSYRKKEASFSKLVEQNSDNEQVLNTQQFFNENSNIRESTVLCLEGTGRVTTELFYRIIKNYILIGRKSIILPCAEIIMLKQETGDFNAYNLVRHILSSKIQLVAIDGLVDDGNLVISPAHKVSILEYFCRQLIMNDVSIIFNGGLPLLESKMFSRGFISFMMDHPRYTSISDCSLTRERRR